jgi:hypothetical protein
MASVSISAKVKLSGGNLGRDEIAPVDLKAGGRILPMPRPRLLSYRKHTPVRTTDPFVAIDRELET